MPSSTSHSQPATRHSDATAFALQRHIQSAVVASAQLAATAQLVMHLAAVRRAFRQLDAAHRTPRDYAYLFQIAANTLDSRLQPPADPFAPIERSTLPPPIDPAVLARSILAASIAAFALERQRLSAPVTFSGAAFIIHRSSFIAFRDEVSPWSRSVQLHLSRDLVPAPQMEQTLQALEAAIPATLDPAPFQQAWDSAYRRAFTAVRESNQLLINRMHELLNKGVAGGASPEDVYQDINDLYRSVGLAPHDPWYTRLVVNNALNRAWQEGRDAVSHDIDERTGSLTPKSWVWGYEWVHGDSQVPRPTHLAMNHHVAPVDNAVWQTFGPPPIAHNCSCARYSIGRQAAIDRGLLHADESPMEGLAFEIPTLTVEQLHSAGLAAEDVDQLAGQPVTQAIHTMPLSGDRFPRSQFNIPPRPLLNPSGVTGEHIPAAGQELLRQTSSAQEILDRLALQKGYVPPTLKRASAELAAQVSTAAQRDPEAATEKWLAHATHVYAGDKDNETALVLDGNGRFLLHQAGPAPEEGKFVVNFTQQQRDAMRTADATLFHNHPSGTSFSLQDLRFAAEQNLQRMVVAGTTGYGTLERYEIHRPATGWPTINQLERAYLQLAADQADDTRSYYASGEGGVSLEQVNNYHRSRIVDAVAQAFQFLYIHKSRLIE